MTTPPSVANFELSTNLAQLPYGLFSQLSRQLDAEEFWRALFSDEDKSSPYSLRFSLINEAIFILSNKVQRKLNDVNGWPSLGPIYCDCLAIVAKPLKACSDSLFKLPMRS